VRRNAEDESLKYANRFTEESIIFAVNQQMSLLTKAAIDAWVPQYVSKPQKVGVLNAGNIPLVGFQDFLAVTLSGHHYLGSISSKSPVLLPEFVRDLYSRLPVFLEPSGTMMAEFVSFDELVSRSDAIIASGTDETIKKVSDSCDENGIPISNRLLRGNRISIAILSGTESNDDLDALAEDALLHEGLGCRNVSIIWAPEHLKPDQLLESMAAFRATFPVHPETASSLKMTQAFLKAVDQPHAYGDNLEFLISKGEPEVQLPGHVRWASYSGIEEIRIWLDSHASSIQMCICSALTEKIIGQPGLVLCARFGQAQRPTLSWCPDRLDTATFLGRLT
jgi:hypothetical protein